ncbi:MAG: HAD family hydrolase [Nitrospirota bacterium]
MSIRAIVFDLYGTLVNIRTDEQDPSLYGEVSKFLSYSHVHISPEGFRASYMAKVKEQLTKSREMYPDVDVLRIFTEIIHESCEGKIEPRLPVFTARLFRSLSRKTFEPFPGIYDMLERVGAAYPLALLSDAQRCYTGPEVDMLNLGRFFRHLFISSDYGYRKPEPRFFSLALKALDVRPQNAVFVGDNAYRDLYGAKKAGMRMVLVRSSEREYEGVVPDFYIESVADLEAILGNML